MKTHTIKRKITGKSFRLIDFHFFNKRGSLDSDTESTEEEGEEEDQDIKKTKWDEKEIFIIQMFGINEKGETCCIYINDYKPFFYIKIGENWTSTNVSELIQDIKQKIGKYYSKSIVSAEIINRNQLYGFTGGKTHNFVKITFENTTALNKVKG